jgi:hypothetical protein
VNKYNNVGSWVDGNGNPVDASHPKAQYFPSLLELGTYRELKRYNLIVKRNQKVEIIPPTLHFPPLDLTVDFRVWSLKNPGLGYLNIESKGKIHDRFEVLARVMREYKKDDYRRLILVVNPVRFTLPLALTDLQSTGHVCSINGLKQKLQERGFI